MGLDHGVGVREADLPWIDLGVRTGYKQRFKGFFDKERNLGARLGSLYAEPHYDAPRHKHTFQQVRYIVDGVLRYGRTEYLAGDCLYIPEGASYGPASPTIGTIDREFQVHYVDIQFMGPSGIPYPTPDEMIQARAALATTGEFKDGVYTRSDGSNHDAFEAILEQITGQPVVYPKSRLFDYPVMRGAAYPWVEHPSLAGLSQKHLGFFFECGPNIKLLSLKAGSRLPKSVAIGHRGVFLLKGEIAFGSETFSGVSFLMLPDGTDYSDIEAKQDAEMLVVAWTLPGRTLPFEIF